MCLKVSSAKWRPFCVGLTVLTDLSSRSCVMASASLMESVIDCCICSFWWFRSDCNVSTYTGGIHMKQMGKDLTRHVGWWPLLWGRTGGSGPPTPGVQPPLTPAQFFLPYPRPLFFLIFFFGYPCPKFRFFLPIPPPIYRQKLPCLAPLTPGPSPTLLGLLSRYLLILSSHCKSFEDWIPTDFVYMYPMFKLQWLQ